MDNNAEKIVILDFGSQYTQVIARRIRESKVYSKVLPYHTPSEKIAEMKPKGIILSGGPASVYAPNAPMPDPRIFQLGAPMLGICYGQQLMAHILGGKVEQGPKREYGDGVLSLDGNCSALLEEVPSGAQVWNSHGDKITELPKGFRASAKSGNSPYAVIEDCKRHFYGLQFHPEVSHTPKGKKIISNFVHGICGCGYRWTMGKFIDKTVRDIQERVGSERVILGLSGGVDSSVAAALLHKAIGGQLTCIFVNNGLLRANETGHVREVFEGHFKMKLRIEEASSLFLGRLKGITDPEQKRKIIGGTFIEVFQKATESVGEAKFLAQGTLYPDVIESVPIADNPACTIKSHHNVGGLPKNMRFQLVEPLRELFKDEVRKIGEKLGLPHEMVWRQPFPGPGLAVRIKGEVTPERIELLQKADAIVEEEMKASKWYYKVWQSFATLPNVRSVGVMGDERTYHEAAGLRVVESRDAMTARWVYLPEKLLRKISDRITNEVKGINRVFLEISNKPPSTIEPE